MTRAPIDWNDKKIEELGRNLDRFARFDHAKFGHAAEADGPSFHDLGFLGRAKAESHHVIFGRRGAGKSILLYELGKWAEAQGFCFIRIDFERIVQKSYPNILIDIMLAIMRELLPYTRQGLRRFIIRNDLSSRIEHAIEDLTYLRDMPDEWTSEYISGQEQEVDAGVRLSRLLELTGGLRGKREQQERQTLAGDKIRSVRNGLDTYRDLLHEVITRLNFAGAIIAIDDFYQIELISQPIVVDYLKRLIHGIPCYLKIATVRHRSMLFARDGINEAGMQAEQDYSSIDLDFSMSNFEPAKNLITAILDTISRRSLGPLKVEALFEPGALDLFIEATGGNPRDTIRLFHEVLTAKRLRRDATLVTRAEVQQAARVLLENVKFEASQSFTYYDQMDDLLTGIVELCRQEQDIGFYVVRDDLRDAPVVSSLLGQLIDSRMIHMFNSGYRPNNHPRTGYVYVLALGIYSEFAAQRSLLARRNSQEAYPELPTTYAMSLLSELPSELELAGKALRL